MPWDHPDPLTLRTTAQSQDIDGLNHTNNAVYVQWCEKVAWAHSEALGLALADYRRLDRAMAIRRGEYDYVLPSGLGDEMTATILRGQRDLVCIELSSGRPRRMPPEFCAVYLAAAVDRPVPEGD
jgi:acyl-CoA thioester hydrolase